MTARSAGVTLSPIANPQSSPSGSIQVSNSQMTARTVKKTANKVIGELISIFQMRQGKYKVDKPAINSIVNMPEVLDFDGLTDQQKSAYRIIRLACQTLLNGTVVIDALLEYEHDSGKTKEYSKEAWESMFGETQNGIDFSTVTTISSSKVFKALAILTLRECDSTILSMLCEANEMTKRPGIPLQKSLAELGILKSIAD